MTRRHLYNFLGMPDFMRYEVMINVGITNEVDFTRKDSLEQFCTIVVQYGLKARFAYEIDEAMRKYKRDSL